jgi:hypothetical protein
MFHDQEFLNIQNHLFAIQKKNNNSIEKSYFQIISHTGLLVNTSFINVYSFSVLSASSLVTISILLLFDS